ncbi:MAG: undecaprenyl-diphosphate phosphatase [Verrucomicrobiota bacterium JB022]|nr:undecaprenyl-diphosphate phosphatase [Verrucomicrobiota bacterium JB022]
MARLFALVFALVAFICPLAAQAETAPEETPPDVMADDSRQLTYMDALILGAVEGLTEYLPVSSTGHLLLTNAWLGLDLQDVMYDDTGAQIVDSAGEPYTLKQAADAYAIVIQGGAIAAVLLIYWRRIWHASKGSVCWALGHFGVRIGDPEENFRGFRLALNLGVAFLPAAVLGLLFNDVIEAYLFGVWPVAVALFAGSLLMFGVERWRRRRHGEMKPDSGPDLPDLALLQSLTIGFLQCVAMWPGTSRSMMTIVGGYVVGLSPARAAEFSFLLGLITLTAAAAYKTVQDGADMMRVLDLGPVLFGCIVAMLFAAFAVKWLVSYLSRHGLSVFAWYRLGLTLVVVVYFGLIAG